jgi:hypothetical protein
MAAALEHNEVSVLKPDAVVSIQTLDYIMCTCRLSPVPRLYFIIIITIIVSPFSLPNCRFSVDMLILV